MSPTGRARRALLAALFVGALRVGAQEPFELQVFLRPDRGIEDSQPFDLVIRVEGATAPSISLPTFAGTPELRLLGGPNTRQVMRFVNGRTATSLEISYTLLAPQPGTFQIPSLELSVNGQARRTAALSVRVERAGSRPAPPGAGTPPPRSDPDDAVFLELELGSRDVWVGQPIPVTITLFTTVDVRSLEWVEQPKFERFWVETLPVDPTRDAFTRRIRGRVYSAHPLDRRVIVAPAPGEFVLEPSTLRMQAHVERPGFFIFARTETLVRKTPERTLVAKALPPGAPEGFGGAVGRYTLSARLDRTSAAVNDAVALRVTVEGQGVLQAAPPPVLGELPEVKVFPPEITESSTRPGTPLGSRKTWEWILVPLRPGKLSLPELRFPYFDPRSERYEVARQGALALDVQPGAEDAGPEARSEIRVEGRDLHYLKGLTGRLRLGNRAVYETPLFRGLLVLPVVLVPLFVVAGRRHARLRLDRGLLRARRAGSTARQRLRAARRKLAAASGVEFHEDLARSLVEYVADRFDRSAAGMTYDTADELLLSRGVDPELRRRFRACLEACDFARFVPASAQAERRAELLAEAGAIIDQLERTR